jgi:hypothetical protein
MNSCGQPFPSVPPIPPLSFSRWVNGAVIHLLCMLYFWLWIARIFDLEYEFALHYVCTCTCIMCLSALAIVECERYAQNVSSYRLLIWYAVCWDYNVYLHSKSIFYLCFHDGFARINLIQMSSRNVYITVVIESRFRNRLQPEFSGIPWYLYEPFVV